MDNSDIFLRSGIDKQLKIYTNDRSIAFTNSDLYFQEFQLEESICDEESIKFGYLQASSIQFKVANSFVPLKGKWLNVDFVLDKDDNNTYPVGKFKVAEDTPAADRRYRTVKCYDALYDVINADVSSWYNALFPTDDTKVTMKTFRNSFFSYFGIEQADISLVNDAIVIEKTISPDELSGKVVLSAILELNGCLGHIGRDAKFHYIYLEQEIQGLYPRNDLYPADDLYPRDVKTSPIGKSVYKNCEYQDFITKSIDKLQIRKEENDIGIIAGSGNNAYVIEDNFLVYGKSTSDLEIIANNILKKITGIRYRPFNANCIGNLLFDLGKPVRLVTKYEMIETYILSRTLTGIQQLSDSYSAKGTEYQQQKINSTSKSIKELKGKTNTLFRSVEETRLEIKDLDDNLSSKITQNAQKIELEVTRATTAENSLSSRITQTAESISLKVSKNEIISEINQTAEEVKIKANKISLDGAVVTNGWVIDENGIHNDIPFTLEKNSYATGMGPYGWNWAFWAGNGKYYVTQDGKLHAEDVEVTGEVNATSGSFTGEVNATSGNFTNVTIEKSCTIAGRTFGSEFTWNGTAITDTYLAGISGEKVGNGFSAGNMTKGTVGRPYSYGGVSFSEAGNTIGGNGLNTFMAKEIKAQVPIPAGGSSIGTSNDRFAVVYASVFNGTLSSSSSRKIKTNIEKYDVTKCIEVINATEIMSYNYKNDVADRTEYIKCAEKRKKEYLDKISKMDDSERPSEEDIASAIAGYDEDIERIKHERETYPEKRYGFISEDAPNELVSMNRETVDTYSAVAMCFGAIQVIDKRLRDLETS